MQRKSRKHITRKLLLLFIAGMLSFSSLHSQTVKAIEYFFDTDPGVGNGTRINLTPAAQIDVILNFNMSSLSLGLHQLFVRALDSDDQWGLYHVFPVIKGTGSQPIVVQRMEYFFDADPGVGNGLSLNLPATALVDATVTLDMSSVTDGIHQLFIRAMDNTGKWSLYQTYPVIKGPGNLLPLTVQKLEFFIDIDPGVGNGIPVPLNPKFIVDSTVLLQIPNTTSDTVNLYIRAQDNRGLWGLYHDTLIAVSCELYKFKPDFSYSDTICANKPIVFTDSGSAAQWKWFFGDGDSSSLQNPVHTYNQPGTFVVSHFVISAKGCISDTMRKTIIVPAGITVNAGPDKEIYLGDNLVLSPVITGSDSLFLWTPGIYLNNNTIRNPTVTGVEDITYTITVTGKGGCTASDSIFVKVLKVPREIKIPNVFSPNGDGINDTWVIQNLNTFANCTVKVFNRYGQLIFTSRGYSQPWNGKYNGKDVPAGTYYYVIQLGNDTKPMSGFVDVIY